jgi:uncharacterized MAPEG superfamily protein
MNVLLWGVLIAALLHVLCAGIVKWGKKDFDNGNPRQWVARLDGYRARAQAAQLNTLEAQPFFFVAVLLALHTGAPMHRLQSLMAAWLLARLAYIWFYVRNRPSLRSLIWAVGLVINIVILFSGSF